MMAMAAMMTATMILMMSIESLFYFSFFIYGKKKGIYRERSLFLEHMTIKGKILFGIFLTLLLVIAGIFLYVSQKETIKQPLKCENSDNKEECIYQLAINSSDYKLCLLLNQTKKECLTRLAVNSDQNSSRPCDKFLNDGDCLIKYSVKNDDDKICEGMDSEHNKIACWIQMATANNKPATCYKIRGLNTQAGCFLQLAVKYQNNDYCRLAVREDNCWIA